MVPLKYWKKSKKTVEELTKRDFRDILDKNGGGVAEYEIFG